MKVFELKPLKIRYIRKSDVGNTLSTIILQDKIYHYAE